MFNLTSSQQFSYFIKSSTLLAFIRFRSGTIEIVWKFAGFQNLENG